MDVDQSSLNRMDYVRLKVGAKDITKVSEVAEGGIGTFLYDFFYEREILGEQPHERDVVLVGVGKESKEQPSLKKPRTEEQSSSKIPKKLEMAPVNESGNGKESQQDGAGGSVVPKMWFSLILLW
jgi:hypothetical protein